MSTEYEEEYDVPQKKEIKKMWPNDSDFMPEEYEDEFVLDMDEDDCESDEDDEIYE